MKKATGLLFTISATISLLYSCRSTKKIQTVITPKKDTIVVDTPPVVNLHDDSVAFMTESYKRIIENRIGFTAFSAKIDVDYEDAEGKKYNVNAHLRMYKDSIIWISITGPLGIEGIRAYITRDSVKLLDKQNKTYVARSVSYLQEVTELPLDLNSLQDLLVGNPVFFDSNLVSYSNSGEMISILSNGNFFKHLFTVDVEKKLPRSSKLDDMGELKNRTCYLTYEDYEDKKGMNFAQKRTINVAEKKKLDIKLKFKQYEFNETLSFPFSIPKNYKTSE
ncbi:MAG: DUF4292 domain-containing protein [Chitinophagaceae bacterium]|nr:DUF4292 domain-containing protein [Chitinophagaceae bacterium]